MAKDATKMISQLISVGFLLSADPAPRTKSKGNTWNFGRNRRRLRQSSCKWRHFQGCALCWELTVLFHKFWSVDRLVWYTVSFCYIYNYSIIDETIQLITIRCTCKPHCLGLHTPCGSTHVLLTRPQYQYWSQSVCHKLSAHTTLTGMEQKCVSSYFCGRSRLQT